MSYDLRSRFRQKIEDAHATAANQLAQGYATTFEDYRERVGRLKGLRDAIDLLEDAAKELNEQ